MSTPDPYVQHSLYVERLAATNANKLDPVLRELATFIRKRVGEEAPVILTKKDLNALLADIRTEFGDAYQGWVDETFSFVTELTDYEAGFQTQILDGQTVDDFTPEQPTDEQAERQVYNTPMMIATGGGAIALNSFISRFKENEMRKVVDIVEGGFYQQNSTSQIITSIVGTKKNGYKDGALFGTKRNATTISKTSGQHVQSQAQQAVDNANKRAVIGYRWVSVLDSSTSKQCRGLDGTEYYFDDPGPKPKPPIHYNCRSTTSPLLREDLVQPETETRKPTGADGKEDPRSTQSTYYSWLKTQPAWFQDSVLGPTEGKIFRNAGLSPEEFRAATIKKNGEPLTISEMAEDDQRIAEYLESQ